MAERHIALHASWLAKLKPVFDAPYMTALSDYLRAEKAQGHTIFPESKHIFAAFAATPFEQVKVVILGQDPYHGDDQAHGLSFSVPPGVRIPPSLKNIYKEIASDLSVPIPSHGYLMAWAEQGVLLLNSVLTVRRGQAASHQGKGWELFTDKVIDVLNREHENIVFMLWGSYAQKKGAAIDKYKHCILTAPHPSPLSAHRGFLGCQHFSKTNAYLSSKQKTPINWQIT